MYKFEPILKTLIWGSESWQLSGVEGSLSVVFEGPEKGKTVAELLAEQHQKLVGRKSYERYGDVFPLLIKFIEANLPLSVQVHPNDELAKKRHNSFGKTEMWYVLHAKKDAYLYAGFNRLLDPESYCRMVEDGSITQALAKHELQEGDVFFLLRAGCTVSEGVRPSRRSSRRVISPIASTISGGWTKTGILVSSIRSWRRMLLIIA